MKSLTILAALALMPLAAPAATCGGHGTRENMFVSAQWLAGHLKDKNLVVLAVGDEKDYKEAHIPGSLFLDYRQTHEVKSASGLQVEMLPMAAVAKVFAALGVSNDTRVVLYWVTDWFSPTGRIYLTLDAMGLGPNVSILDGAMPAWKTEGRPVTADLPSALTPGKLEPCAQTDIVADLDYVKNHLHSPGVRIVDARAPEVYSGANVRSGIMGGHIEGAANIYYNNLLNDQGKLKPAADLQKIFTDAGVKPGDRVVTYCFIGQQASALYTVARYLGYDTRLYDGSMDEWTKHPELPVENPSKK